MYTNRGPYKGCANYETFVMLIWLRSELASEVMACVSASLPCDAPICFCAVLIREHVDGVSPGLSGIWAELLDAALDEVDWEEIAQDFTDTYRFNEER